MKSLLFQPFRLSFFIIYLFASACNKDNSINDQNEEVFSINFKLSGFSSQISPLLNEKEAVLKSVSANLSNYTEGYLYYWSFNNESLIPDTRFNRDLLPSISYANGEIPTSFVSSTYSFENYVAGKALSFAGAKDIIIKMPIKDVFEVKSLGFDVGSPSTGPKDFEIYYSVNLGVEYEVLSSNNQFVNTNTANQKHTYSFSFADKKIHSDTLWIKIVPKAGERGTSGTFNENTGALRMDNLYLKGVAVFQAINSVDKIHYFLFNKDKTEEVVLGSQSFSTGSSVNLSLPKGNYHVCFITNVSDAELLFPENPRLATFYASNVFSNFEASIFGYVGDLVIDKEQTAIIEMERLFSQVKIEFTDKEGLGLVKKIVVEQVHDPFFFAPFSSLTKNPVSDRSLITISKDFSASKQVVFNQFLGKPIEPLLVAYTVHIYDEGGLIRTIPLTSLIKHNMKLVFTGNILEDFQQQSQFAIQRNEVWGEQTEVFF